MAQEMTSYTKADLQEFSEIYTYAYYIVVKDIFMSVLFDKILFMITDCAANEKRSNCRILTYDPAGLSK